jgi:hypothetical protein
MTTDMLTRGHAKNGDWLALGSFKACLSPLFADLGDAYDNRIC